VIKPIANPDDLPFVDVHRVTVAAPTAVVWRALVDVLDRSRLTGGGAYVAVVRGEPRRAAGRFPDEGATVPGFAVERAEEGRLLRLAGRHAFSRYAFTFALAEEGGGTVLSARTDAAFPGLAGRAYRAAVIGSGGHRILVNRLLRAVRRHAERRDVH
jgi:hypothetical protein